MNVSHPGRIGSADEGREQLRRLLFRGGLTPIDEDLDEDLDEDWDEDWDEDLDEVDEHG